MWSVSCLKLLFHQIVNAVNICVEKGNAAFMEAEVVIEVIGDQFCRGIVQGQRNALACMYMVKIICCGWKRILDKESCIPATAFT